MIFVSILLIGLFVFFIINRIQFQRPLDLPLVAFQLVCSNIILAFEITSLLWILNQVWAILAVQTIFAAEAGAYYFFSKKEKSLAKINLTVELKHFWFLQRA